MLNQREQEVRTPSKQNLVTQISRLEQISFLVISFITIVFVVLVVFASYEVRGSDQYWYMAEVEKLVEGNGKTTNYAYPAGIMEKPRVPQPFIHHSLNHYLVLPAAKVLGIYKGWIETNLISSLLAAIFISLLVAKLAGLHAATFAFTIYLLLPITFWQTTQPLMEATIAPFVALGMLLYVWAEDITWRWLILFVVIAAAFYCRVSFLPMMIVVPIAYLAHSTQITVRRVIFAISLLMIGVVLIKVQAILFEEAPGRSFVRLINASVPGISNNMYNHFALAEEPIQISKVWTKIIHGLRLQLFPDQLSLQVFYLPFNILAIVSVSLLIVGKEGRELRIAYSTVGLLFLHLATAFLHQNQFRYLLIVTPALIIAASVVLGKIRIFQTRRFWLPFMAGLIILLVAVDMNIAAHSRTDAIKDKELRLELIGMFEKIIGENDSVLIEYPIPHEQLLGYVLRPRIVLYVWNRYSSEELDYMRRVVDGKWLLCRHGSSLLRKINVASSLMVDLPKPYDDFRLFRILESQK